MGAIQLKKKKKRIALQPPPTVRIHNFIFQKLSHKKTNEGNAQEIETFKNEKKTGRKKGEEHDEGGVIGSCQPISGTGN